MKIAEIRKLCQRNKTIILYRHGHEQWVSDGRAIYPLAGLPTMGKESITALMDVPEDKADGYYIDKSPVPPNICLDDNCQEETLRQTNYTLSDLQPLYTPDGEYILIDPNYLRPLKDFAGEMCLYLRGDPGARYVAVKTGLILRAVILPMTLSGNGYIIEQMEDMTRWYRHLEAETVAAGREAAQQADKQLTMGEEAVQ